MFDDLLGDAGLKKKQLAEYLGLKQATVSAWQGDPPGYAIAYLELYIKMKRVSRLWDAIREVAHD